MKTLAERFDGKYLVNQSTHCWDWTASRNDDGYGEIKAPRGNRKFKAHRVAFELYRGPIPHGKVVDHLCKNTRCVNPMHLRPVTKIENTMIGDGYYAKNARRDACNHGHAFTPQNTVYANGKRRRCRTCKNLQNRASKRRIRSGNG